MPSPVPFNGLSSSWSTQGDLTEEIRLPNVTLAGNALVLIIQSDTSPASDPTVTDDGGNDWEVAVAGVVGNQRICALTSTKKGAGATVPAEHLTVDFGGASTPSFVQFEFFEVPGIAQGAISTVIDGTGSVTHDAASPVPTSAFTPAAGSLIIQYGTGDGSGGPITKFVKGSGYTCFSAQTTLLTGTPIFGDITNFVQYKTASGASETPTYTYLGTSQDSDSIAFALKVDASKGTAPPAGIRVVRELHRAVNTNVSDMTFQFPHTGNLIEVRSQHDQAVTSVVDDDLNTY